MATNQLVDQIIVIDATPMFADVFSGNTPRPAEWPAMPGRYGPEPPYYIWAVQSHAGRKALAALGVTIDYERPWRQSTDWRVSPKLDYGEANRSLCWREEAEALRVALGVQLAGVIYGERCGLNPYSCAFERGDPFMVALNEDGTRAAVIGLRYANGTTRDSN